MITHANSFTSVSVAHYANAASMGFSTSAFVTTNGSVLITLGPDRLPLISHTGAGNVLMMAHCANLFCVPFYKRR